jgi:Icc protein
MPEIKLDQQHPDYIELIQLTDTHIFASPETTFDGVDTSASLQQVINSARSTNWPPDAVVVTGDLVHDPEPEAYERLAEILKTMGLPVFCIPGNHDDPGLMRIFLNQANISTPKTICFDNWIVLMLDSYLPGTHAGRLAESELQYLDEQLATHKGKSALIFLHHPPVSINSPWMDKMGLQNSEGLFSVLDRYRQVRAVIWGHIHQEFDNIRNNVRLFATPSTCVQFMPGVDHYTKDNQTAGYRYLKLYNSGELQTKVARLENL